MHHHLCLVRKCFPTNWTGAELRFVTRLHVVFQRGWTQPHPVTVLAVILLSVFSVPDLLVFAKFTIGGTLTIALITFEGFELELNRSLVSLKCLLNSEPFPTVVTLVQKLLVVD